ncbi:cytochrome P450 736A117-like [Malus sylvestris]|uniref:cytochrome P450 736A117-like n=1 Tax=Malus sylvestris TaxID=3752 RepID=UPI0021AD3CF2|nr:cytochrome P450 736A117-like [Malus sylvestris]
MVVLMKLITETLCLLHPFSFKYFLLVAIFLILIYKWSFTSTPNSSPPSPRKLPVIGNLHQLGLYPHRSLGALAQRHGPLMMLHFGSMPVLVVSSAEAASEVMKTHDITFSDRPKITFFKKLLYDFKDVASAPYGEYWRQVKSICVLHLLSSKKVRSFRAVREEEAKSMINNIMKQSKSTTSSVFNLSDIFLTVTNDVICRITVGTKYNDGREDRKMFKGLSVEFAEIMSRINIGDYVPWLSWFSRLNGLDAKQDDLAKRYDDFLETAVQEHMDGDHVKNEDEKDLVDVLLSLQKANVLAIPIDLVCIKAITLDVFTAGTDTISTALEWTMSELLRHPRVMKKLQNEVRGIVGNKTDLTEDDLVGMHYLKAVIKETLRLHPPLPLLMPRMSSQDVKISGYDIKANTQVIVNAWQIGKDPKSYNNPEEYEPERFLSNDIDYKGTDYELIPFGAGRRGCPGIQFAAAVKEIVLASLVHKFDWALPGGARGEDLDMTESPGGTVHKKYPLKVVAIPYSC